MKSHLLPLGLVLTSTVFAVANYDGAKAIRILVGEDVIPVIDAISQLDLPVWKGVSDEGVPNTNANVDLVVPADKLEKFHEILGNLKTEIMHEDLGASILAESSDSSSAKNIRASGNLNIDYYNNYHSYDEHMKYLTNLQRKYSRNSELVVAGNSLAGRPLTGIHFYGSTPGKPAVVLLGTTHAREWITTMTTEYLAWTLLANSTSPEIESYLLKYDFYIFPIANPDGFVYTQTTNRLWRKNLQTATNSTCLGRDLNRNWPWKWELVGVGGSTDPCAETFKGEAAGDAPENAVIRNYVDKIAATQKVQLFMDIHSYSQLLMTPYGYSCTELAVNNDELQSLANGSVTAIQKVYGTEYQHGPICNIIYPSSGSSVDYVTDVSKAKYAFGMELRDTGTFGFVLPADQILPTAYETWVGISYLLTHMEL